MADDPDASFHDGEEKGSSRAEQGPSVAAKPRGRRNSRFKRPKPVLRSPRSRSRPSRSRSPRSRSPRSRSPRSRSPRSRSKSPRGDASEENSDSASDADSERSLDFVRDGYLTRSDILTRSLKGDCNTLPMSLADKGEILETRIPSRKLNRVHQPTNFVHWTNGHYVPKQTVVSKENLALVASRLKQEAMCDKEYREMTPESTVDKDVLRKNRDKVRDDPASTQMLSIRTGNPIEEHFDATGHRLRMLPEPVSTIRYAPDLPAEDEVTDPKFSVQRSRALIDSSGKLRDRPPVFLEVSVKKLIFSDHPKFSHEDHLNAILLANYSDYYRHLKGGYDVHSLTRLNAGYKALQSLFKEVRDNNLGNHAYGKNLIDTTVETIDVLSNAIAFKRTGEEFKYKAYTAWQALKNERKRKFVSGRGSSAQLHGSTISKLELKPTESVASLFGQVLKMAKLIQNILESLSDAFEENMYNINLLMSNVKRLRSEIKNEIDLGENQKSKLLQCNILCLSEQIVDSNEALELVSRGNKNLTRVVKAEIERRKAVKMETYKARLKVNGHELGCTKPRQLMFPQFALKFEHSFHVEVTSRPKSIEIELLKQGGFPYEYSSVATIPVPIPGHTDNDVSATALSPTESYIEFSSSTQSYFHDKTSEKLGSVPRTVNLTLAERNGSVKRKGKKQNFYDVYEERFTTGSVLCSVNWLADLSVLSNTEAGKVVAPLPDKDLGASRSRLIGAEISQGGDGQISERGKKFQTQQFKRALQGQSRLDPNMPVKQIAKLAHLKDAQVGNNKYRTGQDLFQISKREPVLHFSQSDPTKFKASARFELLKMRSEVPHLFTGSAPIPMSEKEIKRDNHWRSMLKPSAKTDTFEEELAMADFEEQIILKRQKRIQGFLEKVHEQGRGMKKRRSQKHRVEAFVKQAQIPFLTSIGLEGFGKIFARRRKLRPQPVARKPIMKQEKVNLYITVSRARNVPWRYDIKGRQARAPLSPSRSREAEARRKRQSVYGDNEDDGEEDQSNADGEPEVIVELTFQGKKVSTNPSIGTAPAFYESLTLPFKPAMAAGKTGALMPENLLMEKDELTISLFDVTRHHPVKYNKKKGETTEVICKRFLGSFSIPFTTIYTEQRVDGRFRVNAPIVSLGYNYSDDISNIDDGEVKSLKNNLQKKKDESTYVTIMATLENLLVPPEKANYEIRGGETQMLQKRAIGIINGLRRKSLFKDREYTILAPTVDGTMLLITRYIYPQAPPNSPFSPYNMMSTIEECARFVSLIPFLDDFKIGHTKEAWNTSHDFLQLRAGDEEEHAILLCNYFNYLDRTVKNNGCESYIVVGRGVPEGKTVYVMRANGNDVTFWNACTGDGFLKTDDNCTLRVATIANDKNIWLNIQEFDRVSQIEFDLNDTACWQPFFIEKKFEMADMSSCQTSELSYTKPDPDFVDMVQRQLNRTLQDEFRNWRTMAKMTTVPQSVVQKELYETLLQMEYESNGLEMKDFPFSRYEHRRLLEKHGAKYKIYGFPLNITFTDVKSVIKMVKSCDFHENPLHGVKFAISVRCIGYPNDVISVWVYVATLEPRDNA